MRTFGNPRAERAVLEQTYEDLFSAYTYEEHTVNGITKLNKVLSVDDEACAFSTVQSGGNISRTHGEIDYDAKVFCAPEISVKAGMTVDIKRFGKPAVAIFEVVGEPAVYPTHQEIRIKVRRLS